MLSILPSMSDRFVFLACSFCLPCPFVPSRMSVRSIFLVLFCLLSPSVPSYMSARSVFFAPSLRSFLCVCSVFSYPFVPSSPVRPFLLQHITKNHTSLAFPTVQRHRGKITLVSRFHETLQIPLNFISGVLKLSGSLSLFLVSFRRQQISYVF